MSTSTTAVALVELRREVNVKFDVQKMLDEFSEEWEAWKAEGDPDDPDNDDVADGSQVDRLDDPDRPRPARADHRRPEHALADRDAHDGARAAQGFVCETLATLGWEILDYDDWVIPEPMYDDDGTSVKFRDA